jgi:hypothetical protein
MPRCLKLIGIIGKRFVLPVNEMLIGLNVISKSATRARWFDLSSQLSESSLCY